jgi:hypothetical protein
VDAQQLVSGLRADACCMAHLGRPERKQRKSESLLKQIRKFLAKPHVV